MHREAERERKNNMGSKSKKIHRTEENTGTNNR
jgi:hypothetical protein